MQAETYERIHRIWDKLAEYPASQSSQALQFLLHELSNLIDADHGYWLNTFRMDELNKSKDSLLGWRPGPIYYYNELPQDQQGYKEDTKKIASGSYDLDESTQNHLQQAGRFRATLLRDHVSPAYFNSNHYSIKYKSRDITDTLFVIASINADTEIYFCFNRVGKQQPFNATDLEIASYCLRSLNWFHRQILLGYGLLVAEKPLTPTEKKVIHHLLTDLSEKQIAEKLRQKADTTHKHILNIYRKFNVNSRAALMAVWLGHPVD